MNTSESKRCKRCGVEMPAIATENICPACLISCAMASFESGASLSSMAPGEPLISDGTRPHIGKTAFPRTFGGYRLLGLLGRGGMGTVYDAEQVATGRRVALKMLGHGLDSPDMRHRFLREGRLAAGVSHPNSLYIFGSEEVEGWPVITMEIAGGGTLRDRLKKRGPFPVKRAVDAILDVISGLEAAYAAGVLHRDIKPSNCFVGPDGSVKIGDFGLSVSTAARDDSYATDTGVIMGTPAYASPEQLRGNDLDVRADIYSVGATLFTLLTGRAPFDGDNAVQVVVNAVNQKPKPLGDFCDDVPPGLEHAVARCLAKEPDRRYAGYAELRNALLPFSSREPDPASLKVRASAGWIDYLMAFLVPYVILMLSVGNEEFHFRFLLERTFYSARYYMTFLAAGFLYFTIAEGIWGGGLGKRLKGLRVVRTNGRTPGILRGLARIFVPVFCIEIIRMPLLLATISASQVNDLTVTEIAVFCMATTVGPMIPILLVLGARKENGFATCWDVASGTRVVVKPKEAGRPLVTPALPPENPPEDAVSIGPYLLVKELVPGQWMAARDPVLRRQVWLLKREATEPSPARRALGRQGRPRWLQKVETADGTWDAYEAMPGRPFASLVGHGRRVPWGRLRLWLHDLASELWCAEGDRTLPAELSLDHVWINEHGHAVLLDAPWPDVEKPAESMAVGDAAGQQRFLNCMASCVASTGLPLHARPVLQNLADGKFEKLSFFTGTLRGLLDRPAEVSRGIRAGSIFMLPIYVWIMVFVGAHQGAEWLYKIIGDSMAGIAMTITISLLVSCALIQLLELPFRATFSHAIFRLAVVNARGEKAQASRLFMRWAITWLPLLLPMTFSILLFKWGEPAAAFLSALALVLLWIGAAVHTVIHPHRGWHDRFAATWVVRL